MLCGNNAGRLRNKITVYYAPPCTAANNDDVLPLLGADEHMYEVCIVCRCWQVRASSPQSEKDLLFEATLSKKKMIVFILLIIFH